MSVKIAEIYPKVFKSNGSQSVYVRLAEPLTESTELSIKIQPMEKHSILHTENFRIDEENRYPYVQLKATETAGLYVVEHPFTGEQKYSVRVKADDAVVCYSQLYAVDDDLAELKPYKGDTHLHSCRSDGEGTPFEVGCSFRRAGFDFIALTDHHRFAPSLELKSEIEPLTQDFHIFRGEEVHNKNMGYLHIVNFDGESSVNDIIETNQQYVDEQMAEIIATHDMSGLSDPRSVAYRIFVANEIRRVGGLAIMAHPFWPVFGEYHMQTEEVLYLWRNSCYDAMEVIAACDGTGNGNNLQEALRTELLAEGLTVPVVGASDTHTTTPTKDNQHFNKQYTIAFARDFDDVKAAILQQRAVAVDDRGPNRFRAVGRFRFVKYARFLLEEYFPRYAALTAAHADALMQSDGCRTDDIVLAEQQIMEYKQKFFNFKCN